MKCRARPRRHPAADRVLQPRWARPAARKWGQTQVSGSFPPPCSSSPKTPGHHPSIAAQVLPPPGRREAPDGLHIELDPRDIPAGLRPCYLGGWKALVSASPSPLAVASSTPGCRKGAASVLTSVAPPHPAAMLKAAAAPRVAAAPASQAPLGSHSCCPHGGTREKGRSDPLQDGGDLACPATLQC